MRVIKNIRELIKSMEEIDKILINDTINKSFSEIKELENKKAELYEIYDEKKSKIICYFFIALAVALGIFFSIIIADNFLSAQKSSFTNSTRLFISFLLSIVAFLFVTIYIFFFMYQDKYKEYIEKVEKNEKNEKEKEKEKKIKQEAKEIISKYK